MQIREIATCVEKAKRALIVFLSLERKARETVLKLNIADLNSENEIEKVNEKHDTLFLEDIKQSKFLAYETFEEYRRQPDTSIEDVLINFSRHVAKLKVFDILLLEPVFVFRVSRPVHKRKQIGFLTSLEKLYPGTTGNDEDLYDPDLPLQLRKGNKFHLTTFKQHVYQK